MDDKEAIEQLLRSKRALEAFNDILQRRITVRTRQLQEAQDELTKFRPQAAVGQMMSIIAHELQNSLKVIGMATKRIRETGGARARMAKQLGIIEHELDVTSSHLDDLLAYLKLAPAEGTQVNLTSFLEELLGRIQFPPEIELKKEFAATEAVVMANQASLGDAVRRIIRNALEAMPKGGTLLVRTSRDTLKAHITITDTGAGIPAEAQANVFEPFYTTKAEGVGLGLAIAHKVLEAHGGMVTCRSEVGKGTSFDLSLPFCR